MAPVQMYIRQGDSMPSVDVQCVGRDGSAQNLTLALGVTFTMRSRSTGVVKVDHQPASFIDRPSGQVRYVLAVTDRDTLDSYICYFRASFPPVIPGDPADTISFPDSPNYPLYVDVIAD